MDGSQQNDIPDGADAQISHFIPSVELKGSRAEKLRTLDTLIVYLQQLRGTLSGNTTVVREKYESRSPSVQRAWPWFAAGALASAALVLLLLVARGCP